MNRIYNDAADKNVATVVIYANESKALFYDAECTVAVPATDMLNLFLKGVVAVLDGTYYAAVTCTSDGVIDFGFGA